MEVGKVGSNCNNPREIVGSLNKVVAVGQKWMNSKIHFGYRINRTWWVGPQAMKEGWVKDDSGYS